MVLTAVRKMTEIEKIEIFELRPQRGEEVSTRITKLR